MPNWFKKLLDTPQCVYRWSTAPRLSDPVPGSHTEHKCVNAQDPTRTDSQCGGRHVCVKWDCHETKDTR